MLKEEYLSWMDELVKSMMNTPYVGNLGAPVNSSASMVKCLNDYNEMRAAELKSAKRTRIIEDALSENDKIAELENRIKELEEIIKNKKNI